MSTSFEVAFPISMGLALAAMVGFMIAIRFQSIAWEGSYRRISAAMAMIVPIVLLGGTGLLVALRIQRVFRQGRIVPGTVLSKRVTWRGALVIRVSYDLDSMTHKRTVYLIRQPSTERLTPGRSVQLVLPRDRFPLWVLIKEVYE